jgi:Icc-related predicted phosphoesterase
MCSHMEWRKIDLNKGVDSIPQNVDIVMTHGPPMFWDLDDFSSDNNQDWKYCGCEMLTTAMQRMEPVLHCFGHNHEGRGAMSMDWVASEFSEAMSAVGVTNNLEDIEKSG